MFDPLRDFFPSVEKCVKVVDNFFESDNSKAWLHLIHCRACIFHSKFLRLEADDVTIVDARFCLIDLYCAITNKKEQSFVPAVAQSKLKSDLEGW